MTPGRKVRDGEREVGLCPVLGPPGVAPVAVPVAGIGHASRIHLAEDRHARARAVDGIRVADVVAQLERPLHHRTVGGLRWTDDRRGCGGAHAERPRRRSRGSRRAVADRDGDGVTPRRESVIGSNGGDTGAHHLALCGHDDAVDGDRRGGCRDRGAGDQHEEVARGRIPPARHRALLGERQGGGSRDGQALRRSLTKRIHHADGDRMASGTRIGDDAPERRAGPVLDPPGVATVTLPVAGVVDGRLVGVGADDHRRSRPVDPVRARGAERDGETAGETRAVSGCHRRHGRRNGERRGGRGQQEHQHEPSQND